MLRLSRDTRRIVLLLAVFNLLSCSDGSDSSSGLRAFEHTEQRAPCADYQSNRRPLFGDLHVHTSYSFDAQVFELHNDPWDAYAFARAERALALPESAVNPVQSTIVRLRRPLDFAAVTDHAEFLGPLRICQSPGTPGYGSADCVAIRGENAFGPARSISLGLASLQWINQSMSAVPPDYVSVCDETDADCAGAAQSAWKDIQRAAEDFYDRSEDCSFTTFVGYENSSSPDGFNLHRNVIFRNERVQAMPTSAIETGHDARVLWDSLQRECVDLDNGCEAVTIAHNSNFSGGMMFPDPPNKREADAQAYFEPLVELYQHKGSSECRFDLRYGAGVDTEDELCAFEQYAFWRVGINAIAPPPGDFPPRALVRNVLKDGLEIEENLGTNPFRLGFIGSTDGHGAISGFTDEDQYEGHLGAMEATFKQAGSNRGTLPFGTNSPGGLAVLWAEENSRDALFAAMRRREAYATSGTRPVVRFFGGWDLPPRACEADDAIARSYQGGVPMGGVLQNPGTGPLESPEFFVWAVQDSGTADHLGTGLERIQIVKLWRDASGAKHEAVFDIAGAPSPPASVDKTCNAPPAGANELCTVWTDPAFNPEEQSLYYVRVLEQPTCRWSTLQCMAAGVDVFADRDICLEQARKAGLLLGSESEVCCLSETTDPPIERIIQERAWTSPIWYEP